MKKTIIKIYTCIVLISVITSIFLLILNFLGFSVTLSDTNKLYGSQPRYMLADISEAYNEGRMVDIPDGAWCILIDSDGEVVWDMNIPDDIPTHYSINDVAQMTKWFLNDYPVYVRTEEYGLFVLGYPKGSVGKYDMEYSMAWFDSLPQKVMIVLLLNVCIAAILACFLGTGIYKNIKMIMTAIKGLKDEKPVNLKERGMLKAVTHSLNKTSQKMQYKNSVISQRDTARSNWIAGVSHDIRTPLAVILGYAEELSENADISEDEYLKLQSITAQTMKIKKLVEDLNLISALEYDMQPLRVSELNVCSLLRRVVTDIINSNRKADIQLDLDDEKAVILGDENLIERAVFNIINNSIVHNEDCRISIMEKTDKPNNFVIIKISDNGSGVPVEILNNISEIPKTNHGLGLPIAYKIILAHGGEFKAENNNGFCVVLKLPYDFL